MSGADKARQLAFEAAERRVLERLRVPAAGRSSRRRAIVLALAAALFAATFAARLMVGDPSALIANFYVVPIAVLAIEFGTTAGLLAAAVAMGLVVAWSLIQTIHVDALGYVSRGAALLVTGAVVGRVSERLRQDILRRQQTQHDLSLYADQLERANARLVLGMQRLEAFAEIARAVGGETELERVLRLITEHGREIVGAQRLIVCLAEGEELVAVSGDEPPAAPPRRVPSGVSLAGEVLASGRSLRVTADDPRLPGDELLRDARSAILVPLVFRGETLGVLAGIDRADGRSFGEGDEQLLGSVAASAATAVATARSVAAEHLRLSQEAAEQARARWARELHDETLQGLSGVRMVLGAGMGRGGLSALRDAVQAADAHLAEQVRGLRDLISELRPAALDDLGLGLAVESLAGRLAQAGGFEVDVTVDLQPTPRPHELEGAVYRIIQEALSNVVRHAAARHVIVRVDQTPACIEITVTDNGRGFDARLTSEGFGLTGMRERAMLLGGSLSVRSSPNGPTCVTAVLPPSRGMGLVALPPAAGLTPAAAGAGHRPSTS